MLEILRNMARRRARTVLTVMGILTGVLALTVMGALAERINRMVVGSERFFTRQITVYAGRSISGGFVRPGQMDLIREVDGVSQIAPVIEMSLGLETDGFIMGPPPTLQGVDLSSPFVLERLADLPLRAGRRLLPGDSGVALAGSDIATSQNWSVGQTIEVRGNEFELVGILDRLMTLPDQHVYISLEDARYLLLRSTSIPDLLPDEPGPSQETMAPNNVNLGILALDPTQIATGLAVEWASEVDPHELSLAIQEVVPDLRVLSPQRVRQMLRQAMTLFNLIIVGSSVIALIVGGLSVVNTMTMSVSERRSEIGLKKALGAPGRALFAEYLGESALLGVLGGMVGIGLGAVLIMLLNAWGGTAQVFLLTPRLVLFALAFATLLGALSGLIPALHVMRMNPVDALRSP